MAERASKRGGKRSGAGRPKGSKNTLNYGEVAAIAAAKLRPPPSEAPPEVHQLAARALERITDVMEEKVWERQGRNVLAAATRIREEACGPLTQKVEHSADSSFAELLKEARARAAKQE